MSRPQLGRTLIELLVAIALSLLILLGVGALYLGANQSARVAGNVATVEATGYVALSMVGTAIRRAGYAEIIGAQVTGGAGRNNLLYSGPFVRGCTNARFANPAAGDFTCVPVAGAVGDALAVWYQADAVLAAAQGPTPDCVGAAAPLVPITDANYAGRVSGGQLPLVRNVYFLDGNALTCLGNGGLPAAALIEDVEDFKVYFGIDDEAYATAANEWRRPVARRLRSAAEVDALAPLGNLTGWDFVVSVHVCALVRTPDSGVTATTATMFTPCPATAAEAEGGTAPAAAPADGRIRRTYSQVFTLRSRGSSNPLAI
jgi:type II secretory pathway pseudopilin PulG